uniref:hypothetical protein n=1 Tax=Candidatus Thiodubiliella endoseptemdiera TaxID=2738886 RepID=UPI0034DE2BE2
MGAVRTDKPRTNLVAINPDGEGFATQWQWDETAKIAEMEADNIENIGLHIIF